MSSPSASNFGPDEYTSCYCEENIYRLAKKFVDDPVKAQEVNYFVVFISSMSKATPIWGQRARSDNPDEPVLWDYHVILLAHYTDGADSVVYDFDCTMQFPVRSLEYFQKALRTKTRLAGVHEP
jgi:hypothetical protein